MNLVDYKKDKNLLLNELRKYEILLRRLIKEITR